ncbi:MAG TPA: GGDEF domain-containing protein [Spirochaetia bacterium]|nr:GGDEF domain-containing protein [Spirochaetia bacterium]
MFYTQKQSRILLIGGIGVIVLSLFNARFVYRELRLVRDDVRIVNFAGIIRGSIQRYVKLACIRAEVPDDAAVQAALADTAKTVEDAFQRFLTRESGFDVEEGYKLGIRDSEFFSSLEVLHGKWEELKGLVTDYPDGVSVSSVFALSEECWSISNEMVLSVQLLSQQKLENFYMALLFFLVNVVILICGVWFGSRYMQKKLEALASTDSLTGILNRRAFQIVFDAELERCNRYGKVLSFIIIDIDHFKSVNDSFGHKAGDRVLKAVTDTVSTSLRKTDKLFRVGGEEFGIICPETNLENAVLLAERCRQVVEKKVQIEDRQITISLGVGEYRQSESGDAFYKRVDAAMYKAKEMGRNTVARADESIAGSTPG